MRARRRPRYGESADEDDTAGGGLTAKDFVGEGFGGRLGLGQIPAKRKRNRGDGFRVSVEMSDAMILTRSACFYSTGWGRVHEEAGAVVRVEQGLKDEELLVEDDADVAKSGGTRSAARHKRKRADGWPGLEWSGRSKAGRQKKNRSWAGSLAKEGR